MASQRGPFPVRATFPHNSRRMVPEGLSRVWICHGLVYPDEGLQMDSNHRDQEVLKAPQTRGIKGNSVSPLLLQTVLRMVFQPCPIFF